MPSEKIVDGRVVYRPQRLVTSLIYISRELWRNRKARSLDKFPLEDVYIYPVPLVDSGSKPEPVVPPELIKY